MTGFCLNLGGMYDMHGAEARHYRWKPPLEAVVLVQGTLDMV